MQQSRRTFLLQMTAVAAASNVPTWPAPHAQAAGASKQETAGWYDRPMRWAQVAFVEDDPGNYDPKFWLDYFKTIHAEAACLSAGGVVAFYPSQVPLHYKSRWLGEHDSFGELTEGCRKLGMNVMARTDPHACHQDVYDAHLDWILCDSNGAKRRHPADPTLWLTCPFGGYNFEFMTQVHQEIMRLYKPDAIFCNRWAGYAYICYCDHCKASFRAYSGGMELPVTTTPAEPARKAYYQWREKTLFDLWRLWDEKIRAIHRGASYIGNSSGGALSDLNMKTIGELAPTLFADQQGRNGYMVSWKNGMNAKECRATMGNKPIGGIFSIGIEEPPRWKDSVQNGDEIRLWVADGVAHGFRPWFTKFNAKLIDHRWLAVVEDIYKWHYANEKYLRNKQSLARVAMVYSQQTGHFYASGDSAKAKVADAGFGFYQALIEARIPFNMVHDELLDAEHLSPYDTLILPNIAALSDKQCAQLEAFVERGGGVVATFETSLYDENGNPRKEFGLSSLFGATFTGSAHGPMQNSYLQLEHGTSGSSHPLLAGFGNLPRIINAVNQVETKPLDARTESPVEVIPSYPDLPMEEVFQRSTSTSGPGVYLSQHGKGRVVYFPGDLDRTFWSYLDNDQLRLLTNAVRWAMPTPAPVEVKGQGVIDLSVWRQEQSITVHLVNLTNPMMMKGPLREIIASPPQSVRLRVPKGDVVTKVHFLVAGGAAPFMREGDTLIVEVPPIGIHEVIACELA
jgi:hypothetical protein